VAAASAWAGGPHPEPVTIHVFHADMIHFDPKDSEHYTTPLVRSSDNGREIVRTLAIEAPHYPARITAHVELHPVAKDAQSVHDKWDRAAGVRLVVPGMADIEVAKLVTAYGGVTEHEIDVSHLAPLLVGECTFTGFVDTWVSPAWRMDFSLLFEPVPVDTLPDWAGEPMWRDPPQWVFGVLFDPGLTAEDPERVIRVELPDGLSRFVLHYLVSGHCTDGRGADEFVSKENVIAIDEVEIYRFNPWRDDCHAFRAKNPHCRRWSDGSWSSDYSRSGWCPSDAVHPIAIDVPEDLDPGPHVFRIAVDDIRPKDADGHHGYWRVSCHLLGWRE